MRRSTLLLLTCLTMLLPTLGCTELDPGEEVGDGDGDGDGDGLCRPAEGTFNESASCDFENGGSDYIPGSADDQYDACVGDDGTYTLFADPPGSAARVAAFEDIADILWRNGTPSPDDFIAARTIYDEEEGVGSRVARREDLHYPPIPMAEWDAGVDPDKQCSVAVLAEKYPDRCAGPERIQPLIAAALLDGIDALGDPDVAAAKVKAGLVWFYGISVHKEAFTCVAKGNDCDSAWAYYTGGLQADQPGQGVSGLVPTWSQDTHGRIFDGILAVRCWRDLYPDVESYPTYDDLPGDAKDLFDDAWSQLDRSLDRGLVLVLRQQLEAHGTCAGKAANWAFVQTLGNGPILRAAQARDAVLATELGGILTEEDPSDADVARAVEILDEAFPCP